MNAAGLKLLLLPEAAFQHQTSCYYNVLFQGGLKLASLYTHSSGASLSLFSTKVTHPLTPIAMPTITQSKSQQRGLKEPRNGNPA